MIDGKMVELLHGDSGAFCHYCDVSKSEASSLEFIVEGGVGGMPISKTIEQCKERWELLESGQISYNDPQRMGQRHQPLVSQSGRLFAILHQELRSLDFVLKILYHLICGEKVWSGASPSVASPSVKAKVSEAKAEAIRQGKPMSRATFETFLQKN